MTPAAGSEQAFAYLRKVIYDASAIVLEQDKRYLLEARLGPMLVREQIPTYDDLVARLQAPNAAPLRQKVVESLTTHETSFFRDLHPFEILRKNVIPQLLMQQAASKRLNVWCGAASTGQEPYTIAFIVKECGLQLGGWNVQMLATDLSVDILNRARAGVFSQLEVNRGLPVPLLIKFFEKNGLEWRVKDDIRRMIEFRQLNLVEAWPTLPTMDLVFLRNVLIYFDVPTKKRIFEKLAQVVRPGGFLFLGSVETTLNLTSSFQQVPFGKSTCYQRV
jgi:chemotaxis protein methyltransferase CheR